MLLPLLGVLSSVHLEADVPPTGGDFVDVPFDVPAGTVEITVHHVDNDDNVILDWGVWGPNNEFRGWGGGNLEDAVIGVAESSRSYLPGPIAAGTWTVVVGKAKIDNGGHYSIDVTCSDTATLAVRSRASFAPVVLSDQRRWYKGDFHVHSTESGDASATFDQIEQLAMSRGLDFVNLSDHNTSSQHALIAAAQPMYSTLMLRGAEITTYAGHGNAVGLESYVDHRIGYQGRTIANVLDDVAAQGAIFIVNHPTLDLGDNCIGCPWKHDPTPWDKVAGIEVITGKWDVVERIFVPPAIEMWDGLLDQGFRIAPVSGSDDHSAGMGTGFTDAAVGSPTTLVLADNLSEQAIIDAVRAGRTMVMMRGPDDPFVDVHVVTKSGDLAEIGDDVAGISEVTMPVEITGGAGNFVQLWRDGIKLEQIEITSDDFTHTFEDSPGVADHRYRIELINDANSRIVITGHFFIHGVAADGCGCESGSSDRGLAPLLLLGLVTACRRFARRARRDPGSPRSRSARGS